MARAETPGGAEPHAVDPLTAPCAFIRTDANARRIWALNTPAAAAGLFRGQSLADAQAILPDLALADADPDGDAAAIDALGLWALRYSPWVHAALEADGTGLLTIDIQGCERLFGGELALTQNLLARLTARGVTARAGVADTIGAAYALARFGGSMLNVSPPGLLRDGLLQMPVQALRIGAAAEALTRAGLKKIGDVLRIARQPLTARFGAQVVQRLDQALGRASEPLVPLIPPLSHRAHLLFLEPVARHDAIMTAVTRAAGNLTHRLASLGLGARRLRLTLHRTDGAALQIAAGCAAPSHHAPHIARLFQERLTASEDELDFGLGIEGLTLEAEAEPAPPRQSDLDPSAQAYKAAHEEGLHLLIDRLGSRLSLERVQRLAPAASHIPERAVVVRPAAQGGGASGWDAAGRNAPDWEGAERPLLMLPAAEPADVIAEIPDGPPKRFRWRKTLYEAAYAEGPERIAPEWWRLDGRAGQTRDYYRVEDTGGRRFWLYREGTFGAEAVHPKWFVHGVFA